MPFNYLSLFLALVLGGTESGPHSEFAAPCLDTLVPGVIRMSRGVDISKIDLFPSETNAPNGFRRQLFAFTCSQNGRWHHSFDESTRYSRPDQLETVDEISSTSRQISLQFESSQRSVKASLGAALEVDVDFVRGSFSASGAYNSARSMILESSRSVHTKSFSVAGTQLFLSSPSQMPLSAAFKDMLSTLPVTYETDPAPYDELVEEFGTHYFATARFGGSIFFKSFIDNTYLYSSSETSLRAQLEAQFVFLTGKLTGLANSTMVNEKFQTAAQVDYQVYGGQYIPGRTNNCSRRGEWQKSAIKSPWLVGGKLQSIERLIANQSVRQEVKKAIAWKLLRAYAEDLKATLKMSKVPLPEHEQQQLRDIEESLRKAKSTPTGDVQRMKDQLDAMFVIHQQIIDRRLLAVFSTHTHRNMRQ